MKNINVYLLSLGCAKNLVNSELMLGHLANAGYTLLEVRRKNDWVAMAARKD